MAEETRALVEQAGARAFLVQAEFDELEQVLACAKAVTHALEGRHLGFLVNNAAKVVYGDYALSTPEDLDRLWRVNVRAPYFLTQRLLSHMESGARIVNLSSIAARMAFSEVMEYSMTKAAIESFTRVLAQHLGPRGINVNCVSPGEVLTDMSRWLEEPGARSMVLERQALQQLGSPAEVADVVAFLLGPDSRWMTGQILTVSGGYRL
jgi:3-oxoacyl-[acyl-carrier protein] reductase